jgi:cytoskeletal protein RodZ
MTGPNQPRGAQARRAPGGKPAAGGFGPGGRSRSAVGEQLREAREVRGFDLYRAERDTKIRGKYLAALEAGDFADLPGEVYTRGFLRNYASYLGLDPDEIVDEWRRETGDQVSTSVSAGGQPSFAGPRPVKIRRPFRMERTHIAIIGVVVIVALIGSYFGLQITRFLQYPTLGVSDPSGTQTITVAAGTTSYVLRGTATSGTTVLISWDGQDPSPILVGDAGSWTYTAQLHFGSNQFDITAKNLDTNHVSKSARVIIQVPVVTPTPLLPNVAFATPAEGATVSGGVVTVTGTSVSVESVSLSWTFLSAPPLSGATLPPLPAGSPTPTLGPSSSPGPVATPGPTPATARPAADGSFSLAIQLSPGYYQLALTGIGNSGKAVPTVYRGIVVPFTGLNVLVELKGAAASVRYAGDGKYIGGRVWEDGSSFSVTLGKWFCLSTPRPAYVYVTVNGVAFGPVSKLGGTHLYVDTTHAPRDIAACPA